MAAAGLRAMMISHQSVLDVPMHGNRWAITDLMRRAFGFGDGVALTDQNNMIKLGGEFGWQIADNSSDGAAAGLTAGVDLDLQGGKHCDASCWGYTFLPRALDEGLVTADDIDASVRRVLALKFASGVMDRPLADPSRLGSIGAPAHLEQAVEASRQGAVLVINRVGALPLTPAALSGKRIAVIGPLASCGNQSRGGRLGDPTPVACDQRAALVGPYALDTGRLHVPMFPEAIQAAFPAASVAYEQGSGATPFQPGADLIPAAVEAASAADHVVLVLGEWLSTCDEGRDRDSIDLPGAQLELLQAVSQAARARGSKITLLLVNGRPNTLGAGLWGDGAAGLAMVDAMVVLTRPGMGGATAAAELMAGRFNPSGRLAAAWPRGVGQVFSPGVPFQQRRDGEYYVGDTALNVDRVYRGYVGSDSTPLFHLGHGLSFTTFEVQSIEASQPAERPLGLDLQGSAAGVATEGPGVVARTDASAGGFGPNDVIIAADVRVANTGPRDGSAVVQLFITDPWKRASRGASRLVRYWRRLVGFGKVFVKAGESVVTRITARADDVALYGDLVAGEMRRGVLNGEYNVTAALSAGLQGASVLVAVRGGPMAGP